MDSDDLTGDEVFMRRAIELARWGLGAVEPNPMVGCVLVRDQIVIGEGFHETFGESHAEVNALRHAREAGHDPRGASAFVTLEPCSHHGKTPPCADALIDAGIARVLIAQLDPFEKVAGTGAERLRNAGVDVSVGLLEEEARMLNAAYRKRVTTGLPWIIAKYAMTLDGKIATATGDSKWISNERCREIVHRLRGRVDGIMVGVQTVHADDPLLTARPPGKRVPVRMVADSTLRIPVDCRLVQTADEAPLLVMTGTEADPQKAKQLVSAGAEIRHFDGTSTERLESFFRECVRDRQMTNVLCEGGARLLGSLHDAKLIDELQVFVGAKILGGGNGLSAVHGTGANLIADATAYRIESIQLIDGDVWIRALRRVDVEKIL